MTEYHTEKRLLLHYHNVPSCLSIAKKIHDADEAKGVRDIPYNPPTHHPSFPADKLPAYRVPGPVSYDRHQAKCRGGKGSGPSPMTAEEQIARYLGNDDPQGHQTIPNIQAGTPAPEDPTAPNTINTTQPTEHPSNKRRLATSSRPAEHLGGTAGTG